MTAAAELDLAQIQGNILRGYRKPFVRHLVLTVREPEPARRFLADATGGDPAGTPQVTTAEPWSERPDWCLNIGFTHAGLAALGVGGDSLASFPEEFRQGMAARDVKLGDTGPSAPSTWKPEWRDGGAVHLMVSVHADRVADLDEPCQRVRGAGDGSAFTVLGELDGAGFPGGVVHFGYVDGVAQPRFAGVAGDGDGPAGRPGREPPVELGAILLGHPTPFEDVRWEVPQPDRLGRNGSFGAFRVLEQQVEAFEQFLDDQADDLIRRGVDEQLLPAGVEDGWDPPVERRDAVREVLAAKLLGRWRNGVPLVRSPTSPTPDPPIPADQLDDFGFADDPDGLACPMSSHIRRCNPRDARIVQRGAGATRRLVRRGIPYGPAYDPARPIAAERGLLGLFLCASLIVQFEAMQYDWMNLGLQDPRITASNDPIVGNNDPAFSLAALPTAAGSIEIRGFPRFVHTRGGAYLFFPSLEGLRFLGEGGS